MRNKPTAAEKLDRAMQLVEQTLFDLTNAAEKWSFTGRSLWDIRNDRVELARCARSYANAVRALARAT